MENITNLLDNGYSPTVALACITSALVYLFKKYEKSIAKFLRVSDKNYELLTDIKGIIKNNEIVERSIVSQMEELSSQIRSLERRLVDMEKIDTKNSNEIRDILKDIDGIKKYIELYQVIRTFQNTEVKDNGK